MAILEQHVTIEEFLALPEKKPALEYAEGIEFSRGGLSDPDDPAIAIKDFTGAIRSWIEVGTPDPTRLRDRLEATTFAGIATRYAFTTTRHAGFDTVDLVYLRWSTGARVGFALAPEPAPKEER